MHTEPGLMFLHGLESSGRGFKANLLRGILPGILTPDFDGPIEQRMAQLRPLLAERERWMLIGSSFGGLMAALYACERPDHVAKLVLLAPALPRPAFAAAPPAPVEVPVVVYHGQADTVVPLEPTRALAEQVFPTLEFYVVDDDHMLRVTVQALDWPALVQADSR